MNKPKALASSFGVMVSTVLLITAFGTQMGLMQVAAQIEKVNTYDLKVDYMRGTALETVQLPSGIESSYNLSTFPVELIIGEDNENATLVVADKENNLIHFMDENENRFALNDNGVLVPKSYADKYRIVEEIVSESSSLIQRLLIKRSIWRLHTYPPSIRIRPFISHRRI